MKLIILVLAIFCGSITTAQDNQFPLVNIDTTKAGKLYVKSEDYNLKLKITYATLVVPENRLKKESRLITLPIIKVHSSSNSPKEPIFILHGGPGMSNLDFKPWTWLLENHDLVMVGYRGVDGQVSLANSDFPQSMATEGNPFSKENLKRMGKAALTAFNRLKDEGIDMDAYNMLEVIDDFEMARKALGYEKINLFGFSYGTRVAYLYGLKAPKSINRTVIQAVNPPGGFVWKPKNIDNLFKKVAAEWQQNPECFAKSPDILKTFKEVFESLPAKWNKIVPMNKDKIKAMVFMMAYTRKGIAQTFDAFVAAKNGDYSGLAFLCMAYDQLPKMTGMNWGENLSKALSADYEPERDYETTMDPEGSIIGSPMSKIFGIMKYGGWPAQRLPEAYRKLRYSNTETLMISGSIDISTPAVNGTKMLNYLPNGNQVILDNRGHQDIGHLQKDVYRNLVRTYFRTGKVESSEFTKMPIDFSDIKPSFQDMGKMFLNK